jgi:dTDP-4-amino-4,6-dideoxygalactose transaminase
MTVFSFHPVKHVAMGEGGAVTTDDPHLARRLGVIRNHGMVKEGFVNQDMAFDSRGQVNPWYYELQDLGLNYRLSDLHAALGLSQLRRLDQSVAARNRIAVWYREEIARCFTDGSVTPLVTRANVINAHHLFVVFIDFARFGIERGDTMKAASQGWHRHTSALHPIHLQPYYRRCCQHRPGRFPERRGIL